MKKTKKEEKEEGDEKIENLHVRKISRRLWEQFTGIAATRRGKLHGILGEELEEAIRGYIEKSEEEEEEAFERGGTHTHTRETKKEQKNRRKVGDHEIAYQKENGNPKVYPLNSRERRLKAIGRILLGGSGIITQKGLERIIVSQKVGDRRVINDYKKVLEVKGWITRMTKTKYATACDIISEELSIPLVNGHKESERIKEERHKTPEINNGGIVNYGE